MDSYCFTASLLVQENVPRQKRASSCPTTSNTGTFPYLPAEGAVLDRINPFKPISPGQNSSHISMVLILAYASGMKIPLLHGTHTIHCTRSMKSGLQGTNR